jgi:hypothetical protein
MRWCQPHWDGLRAEVDRQGLGEHVGRDGEAVMGKLVASAEAGDVTLESFEPLMAAMLAVNSYVAHAFADGNLLAVYGLEGCPVCFVDEHHMPACQDPAHEKPCTTSIDWCFTNAVADQKAILERLTA